MAEYVYDIGVVCGRFQVFHNDHLKYLLTAKEKCKSLIVGITSPDESTSIAEKQDENRGKKSANPCTYYERMQVIKGALIENGVGYDQFDIVPFPIGKPTLLKAYIPNNAVCFFTIYDDWGVEKVNRIASLGYKTIILWESKEKGLSSSYIRQLIFEKKRWKDYVPNATYEYFIKNGIEERIRMLIEQ